MIVSLSTKPLGEKTPTLAMHTLDETEDGRRGQLQCLKQLAFGGIKGVQSHAYDLQSFTNELVGHECDVSCLMFSVLAKCSERCTFTYH